eukprot:6490989-Amphidinium_carterae.2
MPSHRETTKGKADEVCSGKAQLTLSGCASPPVVSVTPLAGGCQPDRCCCCLGAAGADCFLPLPPDLADLLERRC